MNITYLLGAGASYEALPIVNKIPERLQAFASQFHIDDFHETIKNNYSSNLGRRYLNSLSSIQVQEKKYNEINRFYKDILWLCNESLKHTSIDTFAKKLFLQENTDLKKLKYILSCFFLYEQNFNFDKRYDSFYASILESLSEIPDNLRIIAWNYDSQLEIGYRNFANSSIDNTRNDLNILSKGSNPFKNFSTNKFAIFKVNGTTNLTFKDGTEYDILPDFNIDENSLVENFLEIYSSTKHWRNHKSNMSFAWENFDKNSYFNKNLSESIKETDILIIIGYSFPFFNRKIDEFILDSMPKLKKVYVQDPKYSNEIIEKIKGLKPWQLIKISGGAFEKKVVTKDVIEFIPKTFTDQFFIPIEF